MKRDEGPRDLLNMARGLLRRADPATAGLWPRASALLARQALEASVLGLWERRTLDLQGCSMRAQLICLRTYLGDAELAARAGHAWSALSRACHHHPYELAPTAGDLQGWFGVVVMATSATRKARRNLCPAGRRTAASLLQWGLQSDPEWPQRGTGRSTLPRPLPNQMDSFADVSDRDRIRVRSECLACRLPL